MNDAPCNHQPSDISRIPSEVLGNIITQSLNDPYSSTRGKLYVRKLVNLATVCHLWSTVVFSECSLWTQFQVDYMHKVQCDSPTSSMDRAVATLQRWYSRSGTFPIRLALQIYNRNSHAMDILPLTQWITSLDRWTNIAISLVTNTPIVWHSEMWAMLHETPLAQRQKSGHGCFDNVQSLVLQGLTFSRSDVEQMTEAFPKCANLHLEFITRRSNIDGAFPLGKTISTHPGLLRLTFQTPQQHEDSAAPAELQPLPQDVPIITCRLQRLCINNVALLAPGDLGRIECPELEHLQLEALDNQPIQGRYLAREVRTLITQSACPLKWLRLRRIPIDDNILFGILILTTSLEVLNIKEAFYLGDDMLQGTFFDTLLERQETDLNCATVLPNLREMRIQTTRNQADNWYFIGDQSEYNSHSYTNREYDPNWASFSKSLFNFVCDPRRSWTDPAGYEYRSRWYAPDDTSTTHADECVLVANFRQCGQRYTRLTNVRWDRYIDRATLDRRDREVMVLASRPMFSRPSSRDYRGRIPMNDDMKWKCKCEIGSHWKSDNLFRTDKFFHVDVDDEDD